MKHTLVIVLASVIILTAFSACIEGSAETYENDKLSVIAVNFPSYDLTRIIAGDSINLSMLLPPGADSHSYEPSPRDIIAIGSCDIFIYTGGESDAWLGKILSAADASSTIPLSMMEITRNKPNRSHSHDGDEHVWTSPRNAVLIAKTIADTLCMLDPSNAKMYRNSLTSLLSDLDNLDRRFVNIIQNAKRNTIVFGDRFPLRHFTDAYGLDYLAAFPGCAPETEPSAAAVASLIEKVRADKIPIVFYTEGSDGRTANTIGAETGARAALFHTCHNVSKDEMESGATYLSLMHNNAKILEEALN